MCLKADDPAQKTGGEIAETEIPAAVRRCGEFKHVKGYLAIYRDNRKEK